MRNPFIFEPEPFGSDSRTHYNFEDGSLEYLQRDPFIGYREFGEELGDADKAGRIIDLTTEAELSPKAECLRYEKGEKEKSWCQEGSCQRGHLVADIVRHPRGLLIADFGVGWSGIKAATKKEQLLQDWMREAKSDLFSIILKIYGYSDCVGAEKNNGALRQARAERVYGLLDKDLQSRVAFKGAARTGEYIADNKTREARARNRGVLIELSRFQEGPIEVHGTAPKPPPLPPPRPCNGPGCKKDHPPPPPKPVTDPVLPPKPYKFWVWPWRAPRVITIPPSDGGDSWVWQSIQRASVFLGISITIGMRSLSKVELATALEAAWLVIQIEQRGLTVVIGLAGEAAAEAIIARVIGADAAMVYNLNGLRNNFPVLDVIAPTGVFSVKTRGLLRLKATLNSTLVQEYLQDLINLAVADHPHASAKLAKAAQLLFDNRSTLQRRGSWPTGFNPRSVTDVEKYIRNNSKLLVPHDHVQLLRRRIGSALHARVRRGLKLPAGVDPVKWVNSFADRIDSIGVKSSDLQVLLEATKHLPKDQVERLVREFDALREKRGF